MFLILCIFLVCFSDTTQRLTTLVHTTPHVPHKGATDTGSVDCECEKSDSSDDGSDNGENGTPNSAGDDSTDDDSDSSDDCSESSGNDSVISEDQENETTTHIKPDSNNSEKIVIDEDLYDDFLEALRLFEAHDELAHH